MSVDSLIPGTVLQRGTPWLATTRGLPASRLPQDDPSVAPAGSAGRLAQIFSSLVR